MTPADAAELYYRWRSLYIEGLRTGQGSLGNVEELNHAARAWWDARDSFESFTPAWNDLQDEIRKKDLVIAITYGADTAGQA